MGHRRNGGADHCPHISTSRNAHRGLQ
jgi:hypothetical protein